MYLKTNNPEEAIKLTDKIIKIDSVTSEPFLNLSVYYLNKKDTLTAIPFLEQLSERVSYNDRVKIYNEIYKYYFRHKNFEKTKKYENLIKR
jgi:hypothetical protein